MASMKLAVLLPLLLQAKTAFSSPTTTTPQPNHTVGKLPALGWNSWNAYNCGVTEALVLQAAQQMVSLGLKDAGYEYVNIDDCWSNKSGRDSSTQKLVPDATKFPDGISGLATKIHGMGLKIGIYSDEGKTTCGGYPGSLGYEKIDAETWADWGIDYLKLDNCDVPATWNDASSYSDWYNSKSAQRYLQMTAALATVSRPILFSLCNWGQAQVGSWGARVGNSWRLTGDGTPNWSYVLGAIETKSKWLQYDSFYAHGDMDMMEIGNGALTIQEQRTHFAFWCLLKSPILLGTNLGKLSSEQLDIIKNKELLAFSQDTLFSDPGAPYATPQGTDPPVLWFGASSKGIHVFVLNPGNQGYSFTITFAGVPMLPPANSYVLHDMWQQKDIGTFSGSYTLDLDMHDTAAFLVTPSS